MNTKQAGGKHNKIDYTRPSPTVILYMAIYVDYV